MGAWLSLSYHDCSCDCAGTCVGEQNRRQFVAYLFVQAVEGVLMISVAADAVTLQDSVDAWFQVNWPFLLAWFSVACVLLIAIPLFLYQAFLISTNQVRPVSLSLAAIVYWMEEPHIGRYMAYDRRPGSTRDVRRSRICRRCRTTSARRSIAGA